MSEVDLLHYSKFCRSLLSSESDSKCILVMGNEACDLDSMISSLVYAYYKHLSSNEAILYIPFWQIKREDIELRQECIYLFQSLGLEEVLKNVFCLDDLPILFASVAKKDIFANVIGAILCDHNKITLEVSENINVVAVIDHHVDTQAHPSASPYIIEVYLFLMET